ncbi:MAG: hypothetical protein AAGG48_30020 [Planctomycetota bacterium]
MIFQLQNAMPGPSVHRFVQVSRCCGGIEEVQIVAITEFAITVWWRPADRLCLLRPREVKALMVMAGELLSITDVRTTLTS